VPPARRRLDSPQRRPTRDAIEARSPVSPASVPFTPTRLPSTTVGGGWYRGAQIFSAPWEPNRGRGRRGEGSSTVIHRRCQEVDSEIDRRSDVSKDSPVIGGSVRPETLPCSPSRRGAPSARNDRAENPEMNPIGLFDGHGENPPLSRIW